MISQFPSASGKKGYVQEIDSSCSWTPPPGVGLVYISMCAGGGGGGPFHSGNGGGGGGGAEYRNRIPIILAQNPCTIVIGAGGAPGSDGGTSYFYSEGSDYPLQCDSGKAGATLTGGSGGQNYPGNGGAGGNPPTVGGSIMQNFFVPGSGGGGGSTAADVAGANGGFHGDYVGLGGAYSDSGPSGGGGGSGPFGPGGNGGSGSDSAATSAAANTGGGGGGGSAATGTTGYPPGGSGGNGKIIIAWEA